jgi:hypothetical protein
MPNIEKSKPTDIEITEVSDLLGRIQAILEDREKNYSPVAIVNVLVNLAARYAVVVRWPMRNFLKVCGATYRTQQNVINDMQRQKEAEKAAKNSPVVQSRRN